MESEHELKFSSSWISYLDESMSKQIGKFTHPGFYFVKHLPLGNEFHTILCGRSGILYSMKMLEGKDKPEEAPQKNIHT